MGFSNDWKKIVLQGNQIQKAVPSNEMGFSTYCLDANVLTNQNWDITATMIKPYTLCLIEFSFLIEIQTQINQSKSSPSTFHTKIGKTKSVIKTEKVHSNNEASSIQSYPIYQFSTTFTILSQGIFHSIPIYSTCLGCKKEFSFPIEEYYI